MYSVRNHKDEYSFRNHKDEYSFRNHKEGLFFPQSQGGTILSAITRMGYYSFEKTRLLLTYHKKDLD
jgi:hypothetical protein